MATLEAMVVALCLAGSIQGFAIGAAVLSIRDGDRIGHRWLGALAIGGSAVMLLIVASHRSSGPTTGWLELFETGLWMASGPLVFAYVRHVTRRPVGRTLWLHLAPALAWSLYAIGIVSMRRALAPAYVITPPVSALILYQACYTVTSIWLWRRRPSDVEPGLHRFWVPALLTMLALQHGAQILRFTLRDRPAFDDLVPATGAAAFFVLTALGLRRALLDWNRRRERYAGSRLDAKREREIVELVRAAMETDRLYLEPDLSAPRLAREIGVPRTHLSQALNRRLGEPFQDLIARYRIDESARLLADPSLSHLTVEAIGHRSGFKSRSAFYEAFRRLRSITPAEFRRRHQPLEG